MRVRTHSSAVAGGARYSTRPARAHLVRLGRILDHQTLLCHMSCPKIIAGAAVRRCGHGARSKFRGAVISLILASMNPKRPGERVNDRRRLIVRGAEAGRFGLADAFDRLLPAVVALRDLMAVILAIDGASARVPRPLPQRSRSNLRIVIMTRARPLNGSAFGYSSPT